MTSSDFPAKSPKHLSITEPSPWVVRWAKLVPFGASVLDLAAGGGRHGRLFLQRQCAVTLLDRNIEAIRDLSSRAEVIEADLEDGSSWPLMGRSFDAVVVVNYLHRPLFDDIIAAIAPGGVLIYETFARGNELYSRPRNPDHLLKSGELLDVVRGKLQVVAFEHGLFEAGDIPGVKQRLVAVNDLGLSARDDAEPTPRPL